MTLLLVILISVDFFFVIINYVAAIFCCVASRNMEMHENSFINGFVVLTSLLHIYFKVKCTTGQLFMDSHLGPPTKT